MKPDFLKVQHSSNEALLAPSPCLLPMSAPLARKPLSFFLTPVAPRIVPAPHTVRSPRKTPGLSDSSPVAWPQNRLCSLRVEDARLRATEPRFPPVLVFF